MTTNLIRKKVEEMPQNELIQIYKNVFNSDGGKLVLEDLRRRCYAHTSTSLDSDGVNVLADEMQRNEGKRMVLLMIETFLDVDLEEQENATNP